MANGNSKPGNGYLSRPNILMYALIALVGGGGAVGVNQASSEKVDKVERRVDQLETDTAVIKEKVGNIDKRLENVDEDVNEILKILRNQPPR